MLSLLAGRLTHLTPHRCAQIDVLRHIHSRKHIYRDVKPDNFMLGMAGSKEEHRAFLIDYGCTEKATYYDGSAKAASETGTPAYFSLFTHNADCTSHKHAHECREMFVDCSPSIDMLATAPGYRDDMEGLGYMLAELLTGPDSLPWSKASSAAELERLKRNTAPEDLAPTAEAAGRAGSGIGAPFAVYRVTHALRGAYVHRCS